MILTLVVFSLLINLGLWQLGRADEKLAMEQYLSSREFSQPISMSELESQTKGYLTGIKVKARLTPVSGKYLLLDNQTYQGQVGYLAMQLMINEQGKGVLLERGFVPAAESRSVLPRVEWLNQPIEVTGRLYQRSNNPLSEQLLAEPGPVVRIQNLNLARLAEEWQQPLEPYVFQPQVEDWTYPQPWQPVPMTSSKHIGYAVQWFAMAAALLGLSGWVFVRAINKGVAHE
ncbi:SURF1 family protein [Vibrio sinaloensis]|uniref:SURF1 family protein n=1 Tax=Photobacterium sp. (strain ATCC 43367) TaxID=379097 RepID=UPI002F3E2E40